MNIQHILTLSIDAIALAYSALMAANFVLGLLEEWGKAAPQFQGICAEVLKPIFEEADKVSNAELPVIPEIRILPTEINEIPKAPSLCNVQQGLLLLPSAPPKNNLVQLNIRQLKKKASQAKVKNYNVMTKAQLIQALSA
ncbi:hypothetical protein [Chroococcidiopsis sp.]|uniref:hypothetical protein n=1 Tax=Chroococcidiopsis sp. TaxID=3088168 RepID=UPI003F31BA6E